MDELNVLHSKTGNSVEVYLGKKYLGILWCISRVEYKGERIFLYRADNQLMATFHKRVI